MKSNRSNRFWLAAVTLGALLVVPAAASALTIDDSVNTKFVVTGSTIVATAPANFKISFVSKTMGAKLTLCAGTLEDAAAGRCPIPLVSADAPGLKFLAITDAATLNGKQLWVIHTGAGSAQFSLTIE